MNVSTIAAEYVNHGMVLVPIKHKSKQPYKRKWNLLENCISTLQGAKSLIGNVGLAHMYSRTCALDIDDFDRADIWLAEEGICLSSLLMDESAVQIVSGRENRAKLLYRLPVSIEPPITHQIDGHIEFRCAAKSGTTMQDILPPSIHPETGNPYSWKGDWQNIPELPSDVLAVWLSLSDERQEAKPFVQSGEEIREGSRNTELFIFACSFRSKNKDISTIKTAVLEMNRMRCVPPLTVDEVYLIVDSVSKYAPGQAKLKYMWRDWIKSESGPPSPITRLVLFVLSDYMNENGGSCFPTLETLSKETGLGVSAVKKHMALAVKKEWIFRYSRQGKGQSWRNYGYIANPKVVCDVTQLNVKVGHLSTEGGMPRNPYPLRALPVGVSFD